MLVRITLNEMPNVGRYNNLKYKSLEFEATSGSLSRWKVNLVTIKTEWDVDVAMRRKFVRNKMGGLTLPF